MRGWDLVEGVRLPDPDGNSAALGDGCAVGREVRRPTCTLPFPCWRAIRIPLGSRVELHMAPVGRRAPVCRMRRLKRPTGAPDGGASHRGAAVVVPISGCGMTYFRYSVKGPAGPRS